MSEVDFQIRDKFATILRTLPLLADLRKLGMQFATILRNTPFTNTAFSGFLSQGVFRKKSSDCSYVPFLLPNYGTTKLLTQNLADTILTEMMADEFNNFSRPEIKNYKAEADADIISISGQLQLHGRCRCGVVLSTCFCALYLLQI